MQKYKQIHPLILLCCLDYDGESGKINYKGTSTNLLVRVQDNKLNLSIKKVSTYFPILELAYALAKKEWSSGVVIPRDLDYTNTRESNLLALTTEEHSTYKWCLTCLRKHLKVIPNDRDLNKTRVRYYGVDRRWHTKVFNTPEQASKFIRRGRLKILNVLARLGVDTTSKLLYN